MANYDLTPLINTYRNHANEEVASQQKRYLLNQFDFFGLKTPVARGLQKDFFGKHGYPERSDWHNLIHDLWSRPERECQSLGVDMIERRAKKSIPADLELFEFMITHKSWWDTVDMIAYKLAGNLLLRHPEMVTSATERWIASDNMWLQRTAVIFQLRHRDKTDEDLLFRMCLSVASSSEFFLRKAIGWALREHGKVNPEAVLNFVQKHENQLSPLSKKEALRKIIR